MLLIFWFNLLIIQVLCIDGNGKEARPYAVYPPLQLPLEMPNRNDRADQCWIRVEDIELTHMITVYCHIAREFLRNYIHDYNSRKIAEDQVDVSLWSEEPRKPGTDILPPKWDPKSIKDWRTTTVLDAITHMRIYVTLQADCRLVMYSREGTSNYKVDCERLLFYMNSRTSGSSALCSKFNLIVIVSVIIWFVSL